MADLVDDEDSDVRRVAIVSLGEIGGPGAVRVLRAMVSRDDESVADLVEEALDATL